MFEKDYKPEELKSNLDLLVDQGYLSRDSYSQDNQKFYLYCFTKKTVEEQRWNHLTENARGLVLTEAGRVVSKGVPKLHACEMAMRLDTTIKNCVGDQFRISELIEGEPVNVFFYKGSPIFHGDKTFENTHVNWVKQYRRYLFNSNNVAVYNCIVRLPENKEPYGYSCFSTPGEYIIGGYNYTFTKDALYRVSKESVETSWIGDKPKGTFKFTNTTLENAATLMKKQINVKGFAIYLPNYKGKFKDIKLTTDWYETEIRRLRETKEIFLNKLYEGGNFYDKVDRLLENPRLRLFLEPRIKNLKRGVDEKKLIILKTYASLYSPDKEEFFKAVDKLNDKNSKYLRFLYNDSPIEGLLINDVIREQLKDVRN